MKLKNTENFDVLGELDGHTHDVHTSSSQSTHFYNHDTVIEGDQETVIHDDSHLFFDSILSSGDTEKLSYKEQEDTKKERPKIYGRVLFFIKYLSTSALIFAVLLLSTNYSAYYNIAMSYVFQKDFQERGQSLLNSVEASSVIEKDLQEETFSQQPVQQKHTPLKEEFNSIDTLASQVKRAEVDLGISITPYENRVVIPKIGKNIPLIDIQQKTVEGVDELNDIFMEELEGGVIRYPGSAKPGQAGNTFIFGHSSNFPWMDGDYNDVFSLLDKVVYDDTIIVYYGQKEYTYVIRQKEIIRPGDVSVLKRNEGKSEITLMTCWPIGTTLNRMILIGELVEVK